MTERWVSQWVFCPNCGQPNVQKYPNNMPVADFFCPDCSEAYELKSQRQSIGTKVVDGAYASMIKRLQASSSPNLFLLEYDPSNFEVRNFLVIPKHFFVPDIIERRKPLAQGARRAGWTGCNILLQGVPQKGKIFFVQEKELVPRDMVLLKWRETVFLRNFDATGRGWLRETMICIERFGVSHFTLQDLYRFDKELSRRYLGNRHIREKIRQQLQILRDKGYVEFIGSGHYRLR